MSLRGFVKQSQNILLILLLLSSFSEAADKKKGTTRNLDPDSQGDMKEFKNELDDYLAGPSSDIEPQKLVSGMGEIYKIFKKAADEFHLPLDLLQALSLHESGFSMKVPGPKSKNSGWGMMGLGSGNNPGSLQKAASLLGLSVEKVKTDPLTNVRGGAALLNNCLGKNLLKKKKVHIKEYHSVLKCYSGSKDKFTNQLFADEIFSTMSTGYNQRVESGELITIMPHEDLDDFKPAEIP